MLDNLLFLFTETVLPWYLIILLTQILLLCFTKWKKNRVLRTILYAVIIGSIALSCVAVSAFSYGIGHFADELISIAAALIVFPMMLWIVSVL